ncbi:CopD family protein [Hahella sp. CR1]|uniref:CopD family protein n=1 Tax=unclassified Hahella TaxID=2624107 RepID=UPI002440EF65|nr:CopD family protein [Hahella sp. CR1]MDG9671905.1 CopD family protein [Hahella sp. CR1]
MLSLLKILHVLAALGWVGGMFFAYFILRPTAAEQLQPPQRLPLWSEVLTRFFRWVWIAVLTLWGSGVGMLALWGSKPPLYVHVMLGGALAMTLIFVGVFFFPFRKLKTCTLEKTWSEAGAALNQVRQAVLANLCLGLIVICVAVGKWPL